MLAERVKMKFNLSMGSSYEKEPQLIDGFFAFVVATSCCAEDRLIMQMNFRDMGTWWMELDGVPQGICH